MKPCIIIIGPLPPPYIGPAIATKMILESELKSQLRLVHLDTSDHRSAKNMAKLDLRNICLAIYHVFSLIIYLVKYSPRIVYVPVCQTIIGYLRDAIFIGLSKIFGSRIIVHLRGGYFREMYNKSNCFIKLFLRLSLKQITKAIVLGESLRYIFEGLLPSERIAVVPNGLDRNYIPENDLRKEQKSKTRESPLKILFLSNLLRTKGFMDVLYAIPLVLQKIDKSIKFIFAGESRLTKEEDKEINQFIKQNGLESIIQFSGIVVNDEKKKLLRSSDIFVLPTYNEGQPWVIIEAMAAGLPIISTDKGCIKEMVIDGYNGFIVSKKDPCALAQKIGFLLENENLRKKMGRKSRERFLKYYTKDIFIGNLAKVFEEVLKE